MAKLGLIAIAENVSLTATTVETCLAVQTPTNQAVNIIGWNVSFNGATSTNAPALIEWGFITFATNAPGTNSTSVTPAKKDNARGETPQSTFGKAWSSEPTVWTVLGTIDLAQFNGSWSYLVPWYSPIIAKGGNGFGIRITSPNNVSGTLQLEVEE